MDDLATTVSDEDSLPGSPKKDVIGRIVSGAGLASQQDTVSVAVALARAADRDDVAAVAEGIRRLWQTAWMAPAPPQPVRLGRPVGDCDPLVLEVHRSIEVSGHGGVLPVLPAYVRRGHDEHLRRIAEKVIGGGVSGLVTLVGGSSTGKTRACWELVQCLEQRQPGRWWLWHPYDPSRPDAVLADLARVGPYTIVWLNEAQLYLQPSDARLGERIASGFRTLLQDHERQPVLILATVWPRYWDELTTRPTPGDPDRYAQARDLMAGSRVSVADEFTPAELAGLGGAGVDPRVRQAAAHTEGGRITQYLAGAPVLEDRYRTAPPAACAIIQVAMDARRLGHPSTLPHTLLEQAVPGYLDDHDWDALGEDWLEQALVYTGRPCNGTRGPLTRIRPRPGQPTADSGPSYRLADYLEQIGRTERAAVFPPDSLWTALTTGVTDPALLRDLGEAAERRSRYQHAIRLYTRSADHGDPGALRSLARLRKRAGDLAGAEALYRQAADRGDPDALRVLAGLRERAGDLAGAEALYRQAADRGRPDALRVLAQMRERAGDPTGAEALAVQAADRGDPDALRVLAQMRERAGDPTGAEALCQAAADRGDAWALWALIWSREAAGDTAGAEALAVQAADRGNTWALTVLAQLRELTGDLTGTQTLYQKAADCGDIEALTILAQEVIRDTGAEALAMPAADRGNTWVLTVLAQIRELTGDLTSALALYQTAADCGDRDAQIVLAREKTWTRALRTWSRDTAAEALATQATDRGNTWALVLLELSRGTWDTGAEALAVQATDRGDPDALRLLAQMRERAGDPTGAEALAVQATDRGDPDALRLLAQMRERAGDPTGAEALAVQAADRGNTWVMQSLARLREEAGDLAGAEALAMRIADRGDPDALRVLARLREKAADLAGAEALYRQAADYGDPDALRALAQMRERGGDTTGAEALYRQAADYDSGWVLTDLAWSQEEAGNTAGADRILRFGLTGSGEIATGLDFGS
ncbi:tetratricopeptide repeat protein [Actinoplanes lobatus]|uniref:TPR repeat protein n=3 Tax=Actinoplanes lobatus TaxID=113568 RepID=A0A7W7HKU6_9ACTN|nr:tetratricopeptide repeat protein [Actinoplanes lobatus]MBB4752397.1 TPR repeat protein [Actinoplanes lobatus]